MSVGLTHSSLHKHVSSHRSKLPPVAHAGISTRSFPHTDSLRALTRGSNPRGPSTHVERLAVNQFLHDRETEPRSRLQLRALAKKRVLDVTSGAKSVPTGVHSSIDTRCHRSETPASLRPQLMPLPRRASLQLDDGNRDSSSNNNASSRLVSGREIDSILAQLKPSPIQPPQQPSQSIKSPTNQHEEAHKPKQTAKSTSEVWQAGSTTLARYRRLVGTVARRGLNAILVQAARNVDSRRDRERQSASFIQRHVSAFLVRRRDLHQRVQAVAVLQCWVRRHQTLRRAELAREAAERRSIEEKIRRRGAAVLSIQQLYAAYRARQQRRHQAAIELAQWRETRRTTQLQRACRILLIQRRKRTGRRAETALQGDGELLQENWIESLPVRPRPACLSREGSSSVDCDASECGYAADPTSSSDTPDKLALEPAKSADWAYGASNFIVQETQETIDTMASVLMGTDKAVEDEILPPQGTIVVGCDAGAGEPDPVMLAQQSCATRMDEEAVSVCSMARIINDWGDVLPSSSDGSSLPTNASILVRTGSGLSATESAIERPELNDSQTQWAAALSVVESFLRLAVSRRRDLRFMASTRIQRAARAFLSRHRERAVLMQELSQLRLELAQAWALSISLDVPEQRGRPTDRRSDTRDFDANASDSESEGPDGGVASWRSAETLDCAFLPTRDGFVPPGVRLAGGNGGGHSDGRGLMSLWRWHWPSETWQAATPEH